MQILYRIRNSIGSGTNGQISKKFTKIEESEPHSDFFAYKNVILILD